MAYTTEDIQVLEGYCGRAFSTELVTVLSSLPAGREVSLAEHQDLSSLGVELEWMTGSQARQEAFDAYPGIACQGMGLVPVGNCVEGTGDPYFVRVSDLSLVRVPHDAIGPNYESVQSSHEVVVGDIRELLVDESV